MSRQFFKNGFSQSNHFFNIVITFQVLWRIDFGRKSRISGRGPRRGSFYSFAYFIFGGKGEQGWRLVWLGKILRKRFLKGIMIALDRD